MNMFKNRVGKTLSWRSVGAVAVVLVATTTAMATAATTSAATGGGTATGAAKKVCGTLTPDATFKSESSLLGTEHACEHLKGRQFVETKADRTAMKAEYQAAVADLTTTDPTDVGRGAAPRTRAPRRSGSAPSCCTPARSCCSAGSTPRPTRTPRRTCTTRRPAPVTRRRRRRQSSAAALPRWGTGTAPLGGAGDPPRHPRPVAVRPGHQPWIRQPDTPLGRYYPTATRMADGRVVTAAGTEATASRRTPRWRCTPRRRRARHGHPAGRRRRPRDGLLPAPVADARRDHPADRHEGLPAHPATTPWTTLPRLPIRTGPGSSGPILPGGPAGAEGVGGSVASVGQPTTPRSSTTATPPPAGRSASRADPEGAPEHRASPRRHAFGIGGNARTSTTEGR